MEQPLRHEWEGKMLPLAAATSQESALAGLSPEDLERLRCYGQTLKDTDGVYAQGVSRERVERLRRFVGPDRSEDRLLGRFASGVVYAVSVPLFFAGVVVSTAVLTTSGNPVPSYEVVQKLPAVELLGERTERRVTSDAGTAESLDSHYSPATVGYVNEVEGKLAGLSAPPMSDNVAVGAWLERATAAAGSVSEPPAVQKDLVSLAEAPERMDVTPQSVAALTPGGLAREYLLASAPTKEVMNAVKELPAFREGFYHQMGLGSLAVFAFTGLSGATFAGSLACDAILRGRRRSRARANLELAFARDFPQLSAAHSLKSITNMLEASAPAVKVSPQDTLPRGARGRLPCPCRDPRARTGLKP